MSTTTLTDRSPRSTPPGVTSPVLGPSERSPLVAVAVAMAVAGGILASAEASGVSWMLLLFCAFAVYEEVRCCDVPIRFCAAALIVHLTSVAYAADVSLFMASIVGAVLAATLLLPLCVHGLVRTGALWGGAAIGAIVGIHTMPMILLLATGIAIPLALARVLVDADTRTVRVLSLIAMAAGIQPLL